MLTATYPPRWSQPLRAVSHEVWGLRANRLGAARAAFTSRFPQASKLTSIRVGRTHRSQFANATVSHHPDVHARVVFSAHRFAAVSLDDDLLRRYLYGLNVFSTIEGLAWHEFGHVLCDVVALALTVGTGEGYIAEGREVLAESACALAGLDRASAELSCSQVAVGSGATAELLAESCTQAMLHDRLAPPFARALVSLIYQAWPQ